MGLGDPVDPGDRDGLDSRAGFAVALPQDASLGPPETAYVDDERGGQVTLLWPAGEALKQTRQRGVGLLLSEFQGTVNDGFFTKVVSSGTPVERLTINGNTGYWISGEPHVLFWDGPKGSVDDARRWVGDVLIWSDGPITFRLESASAVTSRSASPRPCASAAPGRPGPRLASQALLTNRWEATKDGIARSRPTESRTDARSRFLLAGATALLVVVAGAYVAYDQVLSGDSVAPLALPSASPAAAADPSTSPDPGGTASATSGASAASADGDVAGTWAVAANSVAGYRVRERLASLSAESDAVGRTSDVTGSITVESDGATTTLTGGTLTVNDDERSPPTRAGATAGCAPRGSRPTASRRPPSRSPAR
jgi:hypothetical protein